MSATAFTDAAAIGINAAFALAVVPVNTITGDNGPDDLEGTSHADMIQGLGGADELRGRAGDDIVIGGTGNDRVRGDGGNDLVQGGDGNDRAEGKAGNDDVQGGAGRDEVRGGGGDDTVAGGTGNDDLWGNAGLDIFAFAPGDGDDKIHDFRATDDVIGVSAFGFASVQEVLDLIISADIDNDGDDDALDSIIVLSATDRIYVENTLPGEFTAANFIV
jgi:Ca2+-binding RTX toxin-like protein